MSVTQTVDIPASRRITVDVPREVPVGRAWVSVFPVAQTPKTTVPLLSLRGSCKGLDTLDAYFARKRADKEQENRSGTTGNS